MIQSIIFRQLFDLESFTYTYLLGDSDSGLAILIDPVRDQFNRDVRLLKELRLTLVYVLDTHIHADHVTASGLLRAATGAKIVMGSGVAIAEPDVLLADEEVLRVSQSLSVKAIATPGHTDGCTSYLVEDMVFTGDALLVRKTGRTDFQWGSAEKLYDSIVNKLYQLPDTTLVFVGHDYQGWTVTTIGEEKEHNERVRAVTTLEEFVNIMQAVKLDRPKKMDVAIPSNLRLGV